MQSNNFLYKNKSKSNIKFRNNDCILLFTGDIFRQFCAKRENVQNGTQRRHQNVLKKEEDSILFVRFDFVFCYLMIRIIGDNFQHARYQSQIITLKRKETNKELTQIFRFLFYLFFTQVNRRAKTAKV